MPAIYISKYNRFVDNVIGRINRILGKSYDPVRVKMPSTKTKDKSNKKNNKGKNKNKKNNKTKRKSSKRGTGEVKNKMGELLVSRMNNEIESDAKRTIESESREPAFVLISKAGSNDFLKNITVTTSEVIRTSPARQRNKNKNKNSTKNGNATKNKTKQSNKNKPKVRATLFGLSTIKREGDVTVNMVSDHTNVKTNFILGPLTLRVEREYGNGGRRELKSATATTAEMYGRLNLKIIHGGAATLQSIRVLQPKQVKVDSADGHDKTREYMWKRSAQIAHLVSQKLSSVAKSMLKPPMTQ